jgi:hypothetical protein
MKMIIFVHQPEYIPWLGFFDKLARCNVFVIYDDAQFVHGSYHNRNRIRTTRGWRWLTVPIVHHHPQQIKDVHISGTQWRQEHINILSHNYQKAPFFNDYFPQIKDALNFNHELLLGLNLHLIKVIAEILELKIKMIRSSEFPYHGQEKNEKLISICKFLGADIYLSGSGGKAYVDEKAFKNSNIKLQWHKYNHPSYLQSIGGFQPNMSVLDLLFNAGPQSREIILKGGATYENLNPLDEAELKAIHIEHAETTMALPSTKIQEHF